MKVLGVNGIRTNGRASTDRLLAEVASRGWATRDVDYPRVNILTARSRARQRDRARYLLEAHTPGDAVLAHSYGALVTMRAMEMGAEFSIVFFFGAALDDDETFPFLGMQQLFNVHTPSDCALALGNLLVAHDFGEMGKSGYRGPSDPRVVNVPAGDQPHEPLHHSDYFLPHNLPRWATFVDSRLRRWAAVNQASDHDD